MSSFDGKTYWIIGASEGLGRALAEALGRQGAHLILSARNADRLAEDLCVTAKRACASDGRDRFRVCSRCRGRGRAG